MSYADLLLHIDSYPTPTTRAAIDEAVRLAASLGGKLTGLAEEVELKVRSNRLADYLIGLGAMATAEEARSVVACREGLAHFKQTATEAGVFQTTIRARLNPYDVADHVARIARTYDLCILPLLGGFDGQLEVANNVVFSSGRPVLAFRVGDAGGLASGPDLVVVAWDGSRCAARAMADALPILVRARRVRVFTIVNDKPHAVSGQGQAAQRHLQMHGVTAVVDEVDGRGDATGVVFDRYIKQHQPDLLVMGAYGHSRAREFLLGGATEHALGSPSCPVLLSH
jgi:nucleotide-binding universal stress UspA family protein